MPAAEAAQQFEALEAQAQKLVSVFAQADYEPVAPALIQPAGLFLDVIGEALRARTYVFTDPDGEELCLRPDLTVPTCRLHLARHPAGNVPAKYCYNGAVFRYQRGGASAAHPREFRQAGIENFAAADREAADALTVALCARALDAAGIADSALRIGDLGIFANLLSALGMPKRWERRLRQTFGRPDAFRTELRRLTADPVGAAPGAPRNLVAKLDPDDRAGATQIVADHLDAAGLELIGTRTLPEIVDSLLAMAADARTAPLDAGAATLIESYLAIRAPARDAVDRIAGLAAGRRLDIAPALDAFVRRLDLLDGEGGRTSAVEFSAEFGRNLQYYTGFVFEIVAPMLGAQSPLAGGGRYDNLLRDVGAPVDVPAVGASIHTERVLAVSQGAA
ncbi:MAG: ATP phosphoribosyltransferase regulatory subunit [Hyphomicrobiaceae bacterium]